MTEKPGDPRAVRHLRPTNMPRESGVMPVDPTGPDDPNEIDSFDDDMLFEQLAKLREPFPADKIEKLPKPKWKKAWEDKRASHCEVCHGYHVTDPALTIHLDYVGHAQVTNRLLEVDPLWSWEPMTLTPEGTPLFANGGLWIKLTICGVTRIGFGDGATVKEVIGDAIRNAAMRFGVALDLWSKADLHEERNPGDGQTSKRSTPRGRVAEDDRAETASDRVAGVGDGSRRSTDQSRPANHEALESLGATCDEYGYDRRTMRGEYAKWAKRVGKDQLDLLEAQSHSITEFAAHLIAQVESLGPDESHSDGDEPEGAPADDTREDPDGSNGGDGQANGEGGVVAAAGQGADGDEAQGDMF